MEHILKNTGQKCLSDHNEQQQITLCIEFNPLLELDGENEKRRLVRFLNQTNYYYVNTS